MSESKNVRPAFASNRILMGIYWLVIVTGFSLAPELLKDIIADEGFLLLIVYVVVTIMVILAFRLYAFLLNRFPTKWYIADAFSFILSGVIYKVSEGFFYVVGIAASIIGFWLFSVTQFPTFDNRLIWTCVYALVAQIIAAATPVFFSIPQKKD